MKSRSRSLAFLILPALLLAGCGGAGEEEEVVLEAVPPDDGGLLTAAAPRTPEIRYGDTVILKNDTWQSFLATPDPGTVKMILWGQAPWAAWQILDEACKCANGNVVRFNDTVFMRSAKWGQFLSARGSGDKADVNVKNVPSTWERFRLIDPSQTASTAPVTWGAAATIWSVQYNNYVSARSGRDYGDVKMMSQPKSWEQWHVLPPAALPNSYWMSELSASLADVPLTQAVIPGSHDSGTYSIADDAAFSPDLPLENLAQFKDLLLANAKLVPQVNRFMARFARAQNTDITEQLDTGIRYFDLRPGASNNGQGTDLLVVHSLYGGDILKIVSAVGAFLLSHPHEVVILDFSHFTAMNDAHHQKLIDHVKTTFGAKLAPRPAGATQANPQANTYTFGQMRANGWQVVALYNNASADAQPTLWRYGTPQETKWWPDKPTTDKVKARLEDLLAKDRPLLSDGSFFVLQTVLTGDAELYGKVVARLEAPLDDMQSRLATLQATFSTLQAAVTDAQDKVDVLNAEIASKQRSIDDYQDWIDHHSSVWDYAGRVWRWAAIGELEGQKWVLEQAASPANDTLSGAQNALAGAKASAADLQSQINALLAVPTSLVELATAGNPTMLGWLDGWRDKRLNIIIQDVPGMDFVNKARAFNTK